LREYEPFKYAFALFDDTFSGRNARKWVRTVPTSAVDQMRSHVILLIKETGRELRQRIQNAAWQIFHGNRGGHESQHRKTVSQ
jgi:hypothetical protein